MASVLLVNRWVLRILSTYRCCYFQVMVRYRSSRVKFHLSVVKRAGTSTWILPSMCLRMCRQTLSKIPTGFVQITVQAILLLKNKLPIDRFTNGQISVVNHNLKKSNSDRVICSLLDQRRLVFLSCSLLRCACETFALKSLFAKPLFDKVHLNTQN